MYWQQRETTSYPIPPELLTMDKNGQTNVYQGPVLPAGCILGRSTDSEGKLTGDDKVVGLAEKDGP